ncbi:MAG: ATP-binding domain-containing protein, partial [Clostridia bacterium]|nr:ATP-binding domain-containing protein [Clostridia bacterium]
MSLLEQGGVEEERRLCYVAITRAKKKLYITSVDSRMIYGS